jgi:hypothetical protein
MLMHSLATSFVTKQLRSRSKPSPKNFLKGDYQDSRGSLAATAIPSCWSLALIFTPRGKKNRQCPQKCEEIEILHYRRNIGPLAEDLDFFNLFTENMNSSDR